MSAPASSMTAVLAALTSNAIVAVAKFIAFSMSGSGAMLSEGVHSLADLGNQILLLIGLRRAGKERDELYPYGYDAERFVWGIFSAAGVFFVGCGVTVYHGVEELLHPRMPHLGVSTLVVLVLSALLEGGSLAIALRAVLKGREDRPLLRYLLHEADPAARAIVLEDSVAVGGLFLAAAGMGLCHLTQNPMWDALASIVVGLLLGAIAVHLAHSNRQLLVGMAIPAEEEKRFVEVVLGSPGIRDVHDVKSRVLAPEAYKLKAEITLDEVELTRRVLAQLSPEFQARPRDEVAAEVTVRVVDAVSDLIDEIERRVEREIPFVRHLDLEVDHTGRKRPVAEVVEQLSRKAQKVS